MFNWTKLKILFFLIFRNEFRFEEDKIGYVVKDVSFKKKINVLRVSLSRTIKTPFALGYPYTVQVNPFLGCNLRCPKCPAHKKNNKIEHGALDFNLYKKFIDEVGDYSFLLTLWSWGEPFLNRRLPEMIRYAKNKKIIVRTSTNGNLLDDDEFNKKIFLSGLDTLIIALDGATKKTYLKYRKVGDFDKVIAGVKNVVRLKKNLGIKKPMINLRMVVTRNNEDEIPQIKEIAREIGVDVLTLKTVNPNADGEMPDLTLIPRNKRYHRYDYDPETGKKIEPKNYVCFFPWGHTTLFNDGTIVPCEMDSKVDFPFGNIKYQSFKEIWFGKKADQFRRQFVKDNNVFDLCRKCPYKGMTIKRGCVAEKIVINS